MPANNTERNTLLSVYNCIQRLTHVYLINVARSEVGVLYVYTIMHYYSNIQRDKTVYTMFPRFANRARKCCKNMHNFNSYVLYKCLLEQ